MSPSTLVATPLLVHASFSGCRLDHLAIPRLPNLRSLNLKNNRLTAVHADAFINVTNLKTLILALNPIQSFILSMRNGISASVETLDVSGIRMFETNPNLSIIFAEVRTLNLSEPGSYRTGMFDTVRSTVHQDVADNLRQFSNYCGDRPQL